MNIVIFASDSKGVSSVINTVRTIQQTTTHNYFFLYSQETQLQYPSHNLDKFTYDSNISEDNWGGIWSDSLNVHLPFTPDVLLIQRDCWQPEQSIIHEFKSKWNSKITMVEVNTHLNNNPETILEMYSRTKYPQNQIDLYFEQSEFTKQERGKSGFDISKSVITGNPKFDNLLEVKTEYCYEKYNIDKKKTQILFYSLINVSRNEMFKCLENLIEKIDHSKYEIFFKPYPGEPFNEKFKSQFFPFIYDKVKVIYDDIDIYPLTKICDIHMGAISSIIHFPLLLSKKIININNFCTYLDGSSSLEKYLTENNIGIEDSAKFWMRIHDLPTYDAFIDLVNPKRVISYKKDIEYFISVIKECTIDYDFELNCLDQKMPDTKKLLKLFDEFNDFNSSKRIIKEIEKLVIV
jgi:hypothetical protein